MVLRQVQADDHQLADDVLTRAAAAEKLSREDARLARRLVFGVLRAALLLDHLYGRFLERGGKSIGPAARVVLRLGTYQHYFLEKVPAHAVVHETVEIGRQVFRLSERELKFVNAILRKVSADILSSEQMAQALPPGNRVSALATRYSFSPEVTSLLVENYGGQKAAAIMESCNVEPPLTIRVNTSLVTVRDLQSALALEGFAAVPGRIAPEALVLVAGAPTADGDVDRGRESSLFETAAFREGLFYVQDEASQLVAHIAKPWLSGRVLDLCAAPGGKTTHLAELGNGRIEITATDESERRLEILRENLTRLGTAGVQVKRLPDLLSNSPDNPAGQFDLVLVDAPCSGLGTIRRHPEIRYRITPENLLRHADRQQEVLRTAAGLTRSGGVIVYSTCSFSRRENRDVIEKFLRDFPDWELVPASPDEAVIGGLATARGTYATWPAFPQLDGFEAAVLRRRH